MMYLSLKNPIYFILYSIYDFYGTLFYNHCNSLNEVSVHHNVCHFARIISFSTQRC